jgi:hypothetical protein
MKICQKYISIQASIFLFVSSVLKFSCWISICLSVWIPFHHGSWEEWLLSVGWCVGWQKGNSSRGCSLNVEMVESDVFFLTTCRSLVIFFKQTPYCTASVFSILERLWWSVADPEISKRGGPLLKGGPTPRNSKKITYLESQFLSFTNIWW